MRTVSAWAIRALLVLAAIVALAALAHLAGYGWNARPVASPKPTAPTPTPSVAPAVVTTDTATATEQQPATPGAHTSPIARATGTPTELAPFIITAIPTATTATTPPAASSPTPTPVPPTATETPTPIPPTATATTRPAPPTAAALAVPLHTEGTRIVDAQGRAVTLATVNWYGAEGPDFVPGGLDKRPYMDILSTIRELGFNSVRLPFSNELVERNPRVYEHLDANRELIGLHALDIMDAIMDGARRVGIVVILDDHRSDAGWSALGNGLWYTPQYPEANWIADWVALAARYRDNPAVVGADLRNEPHSNGPGTEILALGYLRQGATWGPYNGVDQPASDWRLAAERAGDAVLRANPHLLIIVEGTEIYPNPDGTPDIYWWGGNLRGAIDYPVRLDVPGHLVYSAHEYGPRMHSQRWITPTMTEADWDREFDAHWGTLLARTGPDAAPVWVGEFGTPHYGLEDIWDPRSGTQGQWFYSLIHYLKLHPTVGWGFWTLNGTISGGANGQRGRPEAYGLLKPDWLHLADHQLMQALRTIEPT